jgi:NAD(P)-dependent dehydrogenase (short-subunit alcohol dehydrogenase family)
MPLNQVDTFRGLRGKRVLVTGAGRGMGKVIAKGFIQNGARVFICDVDQARLDAFKHDEPSIAAARCDISEAGQVDDLFGAVESVLGGLDILMNNTGISGPRGPIEAIPIDGWERTIAVNLSGAFYVARKAVPLLKAAGGGSIVITSSTSGLMGQPHAAPYVASKFGVIGIARSLAIELGGFGIRVNAICPGPVYSTRQEERMASQAKAEGISVAAARERYFMTYPLSLSLPTVIDPEDIANMVLFICSDSGAKITGQALCVDGDTQTLVEPPPAALLLQQNPDANIPQTAGTYLAAAKARFHARFDD